MLIEIDTRGANIYGALDTASKEIRVLKVLPSSTGNPPRAELHTQNLDIVKDRFHAISYTWGAPQLEHEIVLNGHSVLIAQNAYLLLANYFKTQLAKHRIQYLWVDAICINQASIEERNQQVRLMGEIYSSAHDTVIWLDQFSLNMDRNRALAFMSSSHWEWTYDIAWTFQKLMYILQTNLMRFGLVRKVSMPVVDQLCRMAEHGYWNRLWIMQEVALPRRARVIIRRSLADMRCWVDLSTRAMDYWDDCQGIYEGNLPELLIPIGELKTHNANASTSTLYRLLQNAEQKKCSDVRDRLYGLLGMTIDGHLLSVDYGRSATDLFFECLLTISVQGGWFTFPNRVMNSLQLGMRDLADCLRRYQTDPRYHIRSHSVLLYVDYQRAMLPRGHIFCGEKITPREHRLAVVEEGGQLKFVGFADRGTGLLRDCVPYKSSSSKPRHRDSIELLCSTWELIWLFLFSKSTGEHITDMDARSICSQASLYCQAIQTEQGLNQAVNQISKQPTQAKDPLIISPQLKWNR